MDIDKLKKRYDELFPSNKEKARAFDKIAEQFYFCNFGTMQKSDIEILLFSLYLERILEISEEDMQSYSDYVLSKYLGITQNRVSTLKVKKELKYPYDKFDWKKSFARISENARYENGKIKIYIPDRNLYLEIKNFIESNKGYVDVQLNSNLLQISPEYFIDLMMEISDEENRKILRKKIKEKLNKKEIDTEFMEIKSIGAFLKEKGKNLAENIIIDMMKSSISTLNPLIGKMISNAARAIIDG